MYDCMHVFQSDTKLTTEVMEEDSDEEWDKPHSSHDILQEKDAVLSNCKSAQKSSATGGHPRVIVHIDIDCFYAQVEMIQNPSLKDKPLGVQQKYIVVTCNYPARAYGVTKLMSIKEAKEKCPSLVLVNGEDLTHYRQMSYKISEYLQQYSAKVERLGFDENFLDVTELVNDRISKQQGKEESIFGHVYEEEPSVLDSCSCGCHERLRVGSQVAADIREGLFKELGITCCGGIAHNKLLSKLVAGTHKPNQQTTLFPESTNTLMSSLKSVRNIPGIGHSSSKQLNEMGVVSVKELQDTELSEVKKIFGDAMATTIKQLSLGIDESPVVAFALPQTLSDEDSFKKCSSVAEVQGKIKELLNSLLKRLLEDGRIPATLRLTVRKMSAANKYLNRESRQCPIPNSVFSNFSHDKLSHTSGQLEILAQGLFSKLVDTRQPFHLTLINVAFAKLEQKSRNAITRFFSPKSAKVRHENLKQDAASPEAEKPDMKQNLPSNVTLKTLSNCVQETADDRETINFETDEVNKTERSKLCHGRKTLFHWLSQTPAVNNNRENTENIPCSTMSESTTEKDKNVEEMQASDGTATNKQNILKPPGKSVGHIINEADTNLFRATTYKQTEKRKQCPNETLVTNEQKRQKMMCSFNMIPDHIDKEVFYQLPPSIQQEILVSNNSAEENGSRSNNIFNLDSFLTSKGNSEIENNITKNTHMDTVTKDSPIVKSEFLQKNKKNVDSNRGVKEKAEPFASTGFFRSKIKSELGLKSRAGSRQSTCHQTSDGIPKIATENMSSTSRRLEQISSNLLTSQPENEGIDMAVGFKDKTVSGNNAEKTKGSIEESMVVIQSDSTLLASELDSPGTSLFIPPNVDKETFRCLPPDIQEEMILEWKRNKKGNFAQSNSTPRNEKPSQSNSKLKNEKPSQSNSKQQNVNKPFHFKMPAKSSSNNILSYFPKANR